MTLFLFGREVVPHQTEFPVGIGLRQIIDWMMFVDKCLPDDKWFAFNKMANNIGLEKLALCVTKMCEMYLGLPSRQWTSEANEKLCEQLLDYVLSCGNFGNKRKNDSSISENVLTYARTPKAAIKLLQERGIINWNIEKNIKFYYLLHGYINLVET